MNINMESISECRRERLEHLKKLGWEMIDYNKSYAPAMIVGFVCPECTVHLPLFHKVNSAGYDIYKQSCLTCGFETSLLRKKNGRDERKASSQEKWKKWVSVNCDHKCFVCGGIDSLQAHHIVPVYADKDKMYDVSNGVMLCKECHRKAHMARFQDYDK